jgi:entericidin B
MSALISSKKLVAAALLMALAGLTACNTMEGAGQDIQSGGRALEKSADRNK